VPTGWPTTRPPAHQRPPVDRQQLVWR
jgi:hypothetical protein